jgi:hypothetical protein
MDVKRKFILYRQTMKIEKKKKITRWMDKFQYFGVSDIPPLKV